MQPIEVRKERDMSVSRRARAELNLDDFCPATFTPFLLEMRMGGLSRVLRGKQLGDHALHVESINEAVVVAI